MQADSYVKRVKSFNDVFRKGQPLLGYLTFELTERCNNNCVHCCINLPENDSNAIRNELSTPRIKELLVEARDLGCFKVRFTGGEPLLRDDFIDIYGFTRKLGLKVILSTNGTLLNSAHAAVFSRIPPMDLIEITLYGTNQKDYETLTRSPGSFEAVQRGMRLLREYNIPFAIRGPFVSDTKDDIEAFESIAAGIPWMKGLKMARIISLDPRIRRDDDKKNRRIKNNQPSLETALKFLLRDKAASLKDMKRFVGGPTKVKSDDRLFLCSAGEGGSCTIDPYGFIHACPVLRKPELSYNTDGGDIKTAITGFFPVFKTMKAENPAYLEQCGNCMLRGFCEQCPARSWAEHGVLDKPVSFLCQLAHAQAEYWGVVQEGEKAWEIEDWDGRINKLMNMSHDDCLAV